VAELVPASRVALASAATATGTAAAASAMFAALAGLTDDLLRGALRRSGARSAFAGTVRLVRVAVAHGSSPLQSDRTDSGGEQSANHFAAPRDKAVASQDPSPRGAE